MKPASVTIRSAATFTVKAGSEDPRTTKTGWNKCDCAVALSQIVLKVPDTSASLSQSYWLDRTLSVKSLVHTEDTCAEALLLLFTLAPTVSSKLASELVPEGNQRYVRVSLDKISKNDSHYNSPKILTHNLQTHPGVC